MTQGEITFFEDIAYNTPVLMEIDMTSAKCVPRQFRGQEFIEYAVNCKYHNVEEQVLFTRKMYERLVAEKRVKLFLYSHAKGDRYSSVPRREYFKNEVQYDFVTEEKFRELRKEYGYVTEHPVWSILNKDAYAEEFYPKAEEMYDFIKGIVTVCGNTTKDGNTVPTMKVFFDMWNEFSSETFCILGKLVDDESEKSKEGSVEKLNAF